MYACISLFYKNVGICLGLSQLSTGHQCIFLVEFSNNFIIFKTIPTNIVNSIKNFLKQTSYNLDLQSPNH
ncbi:hypothetical protein EUGRSUZ_I00159 [Eucalyptus grandis]|uniref:Uncharacterized protein n=2 Tax=Eucalyptus grandis TaxID=71139 RepID=A0ACC3JCI7_EUCGR|nr:hypothetical protein EUGRSUZ_I00159 [Eucalyptus grandis]